LRLGGRGRKKTEIFPGFCHRLSIRVVEKSLGKSFREEEGVKGGGSKYCHWGVLLLKNEWPAFCR